MHSNTRACVAYVAARLVSGAAASSVYDYSQSRYLNISGSVDQDHVSVFDYERGCHFAGSPTSLFDYGSNANVSLHITEHHFSGFDYGASHHFSGTVTGRSVSIFDYGASAYFSYSV